MSDQSAEGTDHPTVTVKWWAMGGLRSEEVELEDIESVGLTEHSGGRNPFKIRIDGAAFPQHCFALEWPENVGVPNTGTERSGRVETEGSE